ncbi:MAG: ABC transporter permease [Paracoccaceae bacterium]
MNRVVPRWVDILLIPLINLLLAFLVAGLVVVIIGEDPFRAMKLLIVGALGSNYGVGFTLYYATSFIFTGLAVAVAFHASLFNIGGEGQANFAGLGVALVALTMDWSHWVIVFPLAILGGALFGAAWAAIPAFLQAKRGSHIVITTIMFNYIATAVLGYLLVNTLKVPGSMAPETRRFADGAHLPYIHEVLGWVGIKMSNTPLNISFIWALICCAGVFVLIWRTRLGYRIRAHSEPAARYAGVSPFGIIMITMLISGALAGMMALNVVVGGYSQKLVNDPIQGFGFVGIAVALMGRSHPLGVILASILFGMLYQGGAELAFEMPAISRDMIVAIQALVILFTGALENMVRLPIRRMFLQIRVGGR